MTATSGALVDPSNAEQLRAWDGGEGAYWAEHAEYFDRSVAGALAAGRDLPAPPPDAPGPFSLSGPDRVREILSAAGFDDVDLEGTTGGMWFGTDADDAHRFVLGLMGWMLEGLDEAGRARAGDELRATMAGHETADGVVFGSAAWTIRATRT